MAQQRRQTTPRRQLEQQDGFDQVSPEVGQLDEAAFDELMADDADQALSMLADMSGATDEKLRALARRLAGRVVLDLARSGPPRSRGVGRLRRRSAARAEGDIDVDASLDTLVEAAAGGRPPDHDELIVAEWARPDTALCLLLDASGSMGGERLASAGLAAAAAVLRAPLDHSVVAFGDQLVAVCSQGVRRRADEVVDDIFRLRGHGPTDLHSALINARIQLERSRARRKVTILLSDCEATVGDDPVLAARGLDELLIIAPEGADEAGELADAVGATLAYVGGPSDVPVAFARLLGA